MMAKDVSSRRPPVRPRSRACGRVAANRQRRLGPPLTFAVPPRTRPAAAHAPLAAHAPSPAPSHCAPAPEHKRYIHISIQI